MVELLAAVALAMVHLSRLAEELVWWSNPSIGFVRLADPFVTGSSMLPNKRNPDPAELVRGRAARVIGNLTAILAVLKGLPLGYQRDLQEDKAPLFESVRILRESLAVVTPVIAELGIDEGRLGEAVRGGFLTAVAAADALVELGLPFRSAHAVVGGLVRLAEDRGVGLEGLADTDLIGALAASDDPAGQALAERTDITGAIRGALSVEGALARCDVVGGTAPRRVRAELDVNARRLGLEAGSSG